MIWYNKNNNYNNKLLLKHKINKKKNNYKLKYNNIDKRLFKKLDNYNKINYTFNNN